MTVLQGQAGRSRERGRRWGCRSRRPWRVVGTKSAMLIMREAYYGTTRFDDFARRVGIAESIAAARLRDLVDAGLLDRRPYQEPGQRTRYEYVLTEAGTELMPVVWAMFEWGRNILRRRGTAAHPPGVRSAGRRRDRLCRRSSRATRRAGDPARRADT